MLPPPTTTPSATPSARVADQVGRDPFEGRLMDAEMVRPHGGLAGDFHDHAAVDRLGHGALAFRSPRLSSLGPTGSTAQAALPRRSVGQAQSYSDSCFSIPSPTA